MSAPKKWPLPSGFTSRLRDVGFDRGDGVAVDVGPIDALGERLQVERLAHLTPADHLRHHPDGMGAPRKIRVGAMEDDEVRVLHVGRPLPRFKLARQRAGQDLLVDADVLAPGENAGRLAAVLGLVEPFGRP